MENFVTPTGFRIPKRSARESLYRLSYPDPHSHKQLYIYLNLSNSKEYYDLYSSLNIIRVIKPRRMKWAGHVARIEECAEAHRVSVRKNEGRRPLGRSRRRWENNIKNGS
jgi:hypothetical protein